MTPIDIDVEIEGWKTGVAARNQPPYRPLPFAQKIDDPEGRVITRWRPTAEELAKLLAGDDICLELMLFDQLSMVPQHVGVWSDRVACVDGSVE